MHIWNPVTHAARLPHKYGAALSPTATGFRDWLVAQPNIAAYFQMDGVLTQKEEVSGIDYPATNPGIGVKGARLDTMFWGDDSSSFDFGVDKASDTLTATGVGTGSVTGTYRFSVIYTGNSNPYPYYNVGYSPWITVSGVDHIDVAFAVSPGVPISGQWAAQYNHADQYKTLSSTSALSISPDSTALNPAGFTTPYSGLSATYRPRAIRESLGHVEVGNLCTFAGTSHFTVMVNIRFDLWNENHLGPDWNWIVSNFNSDKTDGWGLAIALIDYNDLAIMGVRRNASGEDSVTILNLAPASSLLTAQRSVQMTYNGATIRLAVDGNWGPGGTVPTTVASTRAIVGASNSLRIGDGFCGLVDDVIIFNTNIADATMDSVFAHRDDVYQTSTVGEIYNGTPTITEVDPYPAVFSTSRSVLKFNPGAWPTYSTIWEGYLGEATVGIALRIDPVSNHAIMCEWFYDPVAGLGMRCYPRVFGSPATEFQHGVNSTNGGVFPSSPGNPLATYSASGVHLSQNTDYWVTADVNTISSQHLVTMGFHTIEPWFARFGEDTPVLEGTVLITGGGYPTMFNQPKKTGLATYRPMSPSASLLFFKTSSVIIG